MVGSIGVLAVAGLAVTLNWRDIRIVFAQDPIGAGFAACINASLLLWEVVVVGKLVAGSKDAGAHAKNAAATTWAMFLGIWALAWLLPGKELFPAIFLYSWTILIGWVQLLIPFPVFLLLQWIGGAALMGIRWSRIWRGAALNAIGFNAVLGAIAIIQLSGSPDSLGSQAYWFFTIGTGIHLFAIWQIAAGSKYDWVWSGLIGWGCLLTGWFLAHVLQIAPDKNIRPGVSAVGYTIYLGWYGFVPYLPIVAYVVAAIASIGLRRSAGAGPAGTRLTGAGS